MSCKCWWMKLSRNYDIIKEMKVKPTIREVKVVMNSLGYEKEVMRHYNDKRVRGGRIKAYFSGTVSGVPLRTIEGRLNVLFPEYVFKVEHYNNKAITFKWKDEDAMFDYGRTL